MDFAVTDRLSMLKHFVGANTHELDKSESCLLYMSRLLETSDKKKLHSNPAACEDEYAQKKSWCH